MADKPLPKISRRPAPPKKRDKKVGVPPRDSHGTQVRFNVVCARCGRDDTLPFVPKTQGTMLCRRCAREVFGPDWAHGRDVDDPEGASYPFTCAKCHRVDRVPFKPSPGRELLCRACLRGEEQPQHDRLKKMKKVE
jgi:CxxC-x17-CxxC domain-containing protein